jgi:hypothetical protein
MGCTLVTQPTLAARLAGDPDGAFEEPVHRRLV